MVSEYTMEDEIKSVEKIIDEINSCNEDCQKMFKALKVHGMIMFKYYYALQICLLNIMH